MKNNVFTKEKAQAIAIGAVEVLTVPTHMGLILGGNLVKATTDYLAHKVADAEGYVVNKIDPGRNAALVAEYREEFTNNKLLEAANVVGHAQMKLRQTLSSMKKDIKEGVAEVSNAVNLIDDDELEVSKLTFHISHLKDLIKLEYANDSQSIDERRKNVNNIQLEIARTTKKLNTLLKKKEMASPVAQHTPTPVVE